MGFPLHKPYPYSWNICESQIILSNSRIVSFASNPILESLNQATIQTFIQSEKTQTLKTIKTSNQFPKILTRKTKSNKKKRSNDSNEQFFSVFLDWIKTQRLLRIFYDLSNDGRFPFRASPPVDADEESKWPSKSKSSPRHRLVWWRFRKLKGRILHGDSNLWLELYGSEG